MAEETVSRRKNQQMIDTRFFEGEYKRRQWVANAEFGTTVEQVLDPAYWAHIAQKLSPYDHIEVRVDDSTWLAEVLVLEAGRNWARVFLLNKWPLDTADIAQTVTDGYEVAWKGPQHRWCVIRSSDKAMLAKDLTKPQAQEWLRGFEKQLA